MHAGSFQIRALGICAIGMVCSLIACSGGGGASSGSSPAPAAVAAPSVSVTLASNPNQVAAGSAIAIAATVSGATNTSLVWSVDNITNGNATVGTISGSGSSVTYTAPATLGSHTITAASLADPTKSASFSLMVQAPITGSVAITPPTTTLTTAGALSLSATVTGSANTSVTWTVDGVPNGNGTVGTITGTGNTVTYTAPGTAGTHTVTATSVADSSHSDSSTIVVQSGCAPAPTSSQVLNVLDAAYGAKGNGVADDTAAIQRAINAVGAGGTVYIPNGTYLINPIAIPTGGNHGLALKSNMTLKLSSGAILKAIPNAATTYAIVMVQNVTGVNIVGGTIQGDRATHTGTTGEWGMGISLIGAHQTTVEGVTAKDCWGDGFYVSGESTDITMCNVIADHNRRLGLGITSVDGMVVRNSSFINTAGTAPEAGIDLEPNVGETVANLLITGCTLSNNAGNGFEGGVPIANTGLAFMHDVVFDRNTLNANGVNPEDGSIRNGILLSNSDGTKITNNLITNTTGRGMLLRDKATHTLISGNTISGTIMIPGNSFWTGGGIYLGVCGYSSVTGNIVRNNAGFGIQQAVADSTVVISGNTVTGNGLTP